MCLLDVMIFSEDERLLYLDSLPKEFIDTAKKVLKSSKPSKTLTPIGRMFYDDECRGNQW